MGVVARKSIFIYGANLIASLAGFLYWVLVAKLVSSNVLGTASTVISLINITITLSTLRLSTAILRVGTIYRNEIGKVAFTALTLDLTTITLIVLGALTVYAKILGSTQLTLHIIPLALAWTPTIALRLVLITTRNAKYIPHIQILSVTARIGLGIATPHKNFVK